MSEQNLEMIIKRLEKLEAAVFKSKNTTSVNDKNYDGPMGGLRLLVDNNFFKNKRTLSEVKSELEKKEYHYSVQAAQTALNRLSKSGGPLVSLKEGGRKVYVKRK